MKDKGLWGQGAGIHTSVRAFYHEICFLRARRAHCAGGRGEDEYFGVSGGIPMHVQNQ